jgi:hypothetical protein
LCNAVSVISVSVSSGLLKTDCRRKLFKSAVLLYPFSQGLQLDYRVDAFNIEEETNLGRMKLTLLLYGFLVLQTVKWKEGNLD